MMKIPKTNPSSRFPVPSKKVAPYRGATFLYLALCFAANTRYFIDTIAVYK